VAVNLTCLDFRMVSHWMSSMEQAKLQLLIVKHNTPRAQNVTTD
jgi:hypothetical protein